MNCSHKPRDMRSANQLITAAIIMCGILLIGCADDASSSSGTGTDTNDTDTTQQPIAEGDEGGPCYGNGTCNGTLQCVSSLCVDLGSLDTNLNDSDTTDTDDSDQSSDSNDSEEPLVNNLIKNGDFSIADHYYWNIDANAGTVGYTDSTGELCLANMAEPTCDSYGCYDTNVSFSLGYPTSDSDAFAIEAGATYLLRYQVKGTGTFDLKIGGALPPYAEVVTYSNNTVNSTSYVTQAETIISTVSEPTSGLVFNGVLTAMYDELCFTNISLVRQ